MKYAVKERAFFSNEKNVYLLSEIVPIVVATIALFFIELYNTSLEIRTSVTLPKQVPSQNLILVPSRGLNLPSFKNWSFIHQTHSKWNSLAFFLEL